MCRHHRDEGKEFINIFCHGSSASDVRAEMQPDPIPMHRRLSDHFRSTPLQKTLFPPQKLGSCHERKLHHEEEIFVMWWYFLMLTRSDEKEKKNLRRLRKMIFPLLSSFYSFLASEKIVMKRRKKKSFHLRNTRHSSEFDVTLLTPVWFAFLHRCCCLLMGAFFFSFILWFI